MLLHFLQTFHVWFFFFTILINYQADDWFCMLDPSYVPLVSIRNPHINCAWAARANLNTLKPFSFRESGAAGWSGLDCVLREVSSVNTESSVVGQRSSCDLPEWTSVCLVKSTEWTWSTVRNKFPRPSAITSQICRERLSGTQPWGYF